MGLMLLVISSHFMITNISHEDEYHRVWSSDLSSISAIATDDGIEPTIKIHSDNTPGKNFNLKFVGEGLTTRVFENAKPLVEGRDAKIYLNGDLDSPVFLESNKVTGMIPGMEIRLKKPTSLPITLVHDKSHDKYCPQD